MEIWPTSLKRGDRIEKFEGHFVGCIGAFCSVCLEGKKREQPFEVLLVEGSPQEKTLRARLGDAQHQVHEGRLTEGKVSFTLEAFRADRGGEPLVHLRKDSHSFEVPVRGELRENIINNCVREGIKGALLHVEGFATSLNIFGHTNPKLLNDQTKTFQQFNEWVAIEGWGNLSYIDDHTPFVHVHGTVERQKEKRGGHFIMDDQTKLFVEKGRLLIFPVSPIMRIKQKEDFPTWKIGL